MNTFLRQYHEADVDLADNGEKKNNTQNRTLT